MAGEEELGLNFKTRLPKYLVGFLPPLFRARPDSIWVFADWCTLEMKLFCRYIGGLSAGHISQSLGRLKYIAIYRIHSAGSNISQYIGPFSDRVKILIILVFIVVLQHISLHRIVVVHATNFTFSFF